MNHRTFHNCRQNTSPIHSHNNLAEEKRWPNLQQVDTPTQNTHGRQILSNWPIHWNNHSRFSVIGIYWNNWSQVHEPSAAKVKQTVVKQSLLQYIVISLISFGHSPNRVYYPIADPGKYLPGATASGRKIKSDKINVHPGFPCQKKSFHPPLTEGNPREGNPGH